jgi:hypothetical protein
MASQVTVFVENKPGRISRIARKLGDGGINIRAITISDMGEYGLINIISDDPERTAQVLADEGFSVSRKHVIAIIIDDKPGGLADMTEHLNEHGVNVSNAYGFILKQGERAVLILEVDDYEEAEKLIRRGGFHTLTKEELHNL